MSYAFQAAVPDPLRLVLRPVTAADADEASALIDESRPELGRWLDWATTSNRADYLSFIDGTHRRRRPERGVDTFALVIDGRIAGTIEVHDPDDNHRSASIGYWLGTRYTGAGWMTMAVMRLTESVFALGYLQRLEIYAAVANVPSRRVAERAGFALEGIVHKRLRIDGIWHDAALYARVNEPRGRAPIA
jgi:ribosomal-protein-serine acetyltransferase